MKINLVTHLFEFSNLKKEKDVIFIPELYLENNDTIRYKQLKYDHSF